LPSGELADPPPAAVQTWLAKWTSVRFRPLTDPELAGVRITAAAAKGVALTLPPQGYGPDGSVIEWTKVGCVFLGYYKGPPMPSVGYVAPEFPAYLVQLIGAPAPGFPNLNIEVVAINAQTGQQDGGPGSTGAGPMLGTTCGVSP
jgi:hypothetical protein